MSPDADHIFHGSIRAGEVRRYHDITHERMVAHVLPGAFYVTSRPEVIVTLLGSCVAVCLRDTITGIGGMNHFLLPHAQKIPDSSEKARYGVFAMQALFDAVVKLGGRNRWEAKIFGGADMLAQMKDKIGQRNVDFALEFLARADAPVTALDVGGDRPRTVYFTPSSGEIRVRYGANELEM